MPTGLPSVLVRSPGSPAWAIELGTSWGPCINICGNERTSDAQKGGWGFAEDGFFAYSESDPRFVGYLKECSRLGYILLESIRRSITDRREKLAVVGRLT